MQTLSEYIATKNEATRAWVAEAPDSRWACGLVEDEAHWLAYGVTTPEELEHYLLVAEAYDLHKSAFGMRGSWSHFMAMTDEKLREECEFLARMAREEQARFDEMERLEMEAEAREEREHAEAVARAMQAQSGFSLGLAFASLGL
jgi:hypothetical protein